MTQALAGAGAPRRVAPAIQRRPEDRWLVAPVHRVSLAMSGVVLASLVLHAGVLIFATLGDTPAPPRTEISVELVQEPKQEPKKEPEQDSKQDSKPVPNSDRKAPDAAAAPEPTKTEPTKTEPLKTEPVKTEPTKAEAPKSDAPKSEAPKPELRETEAETKPIEPPKAPDAKPERPPPAEEKLATDKLATDTLPESADATTTLRQELETLKAEQTALADEATRTAQNDPAAQPPAMLADPKIGGIPPSFAAVALPGLSEIDGVATGYQELVFSQLAKAKGIRRHMGVPGTAGVVFSVDATGKLVKATIAHPSGSAALDKEALDIVNAAGRFPKPPPGSERTFSANFNFVPQAAP